MLGKGMHVCEFVHMEARGETSDGLLYPSAILWGQGLSLMLVLGWHQEVPEKTPVCLPQGSVTVSYHMGARIQTQTPCLFSKCSYPPDYFSSPLFCFCLITTSYEIDIIYQRKNGKLNFSFLCVEKANGFPFRGA